MCLIIVLILSDSINISCTTYLWYFFYKWARLFPPRTSPPHPLQYTQYNFDDVGGGGGVLKKCRQSAQTGKFKKNIVQNEH